MTLAQERTLPLAEFLGISYEGSELMVAREEVVTRCMTEAGFRYVAVDWAAIEAAIDEATPSMTEAATLTRQGYGFAASLLGPAQAIPDPEGADLNVALYESLSPEEKAAWDQQLGICWEVAAQEIPSPSVIYSRISDELETLNQQIASDSRIVAAITSWSQCMADRGFRYANRDAIGEHLGSLQAPLLERVQAAGGPDNIDATLQDDIDNLAALELEIARADVSCRADLDEVIFNVTVEYQQRFIEENSDRLALLRHEAEGLVHTPGDE